MIDDKMGISSKDGIEILDNENIEFIVKSPGIAWTSELLVKAKEKNIKIISEIDLAYNYMDESTKIISFTGTNGKTTTATKMDELLSFAGRRTKLAGNAGFSFAKLISDEVPLDYVVLELSSYQLENNPKVHSYISGIINLTPDHLTRYSSLDDYYTTKFNIFENQTTDDFALINLDDKEFERLYETQKLKNKIKSKKIYFESVSGRKNLSLNLNFIKTLSNFPPLSGSFLLFSQSKISLFLCFFEHDKMQKPEWSQLLLFR